MTKRSFWKTPAVLLALGLALAPVLTGCPTDGNGGASTVCNFSGCDCVICICDNRDCGNVGPGWHGETLNLSGQVWTAYWDDDNDRLVYTRFTDNRAVYAWVWTWGASEWGDRAYLDVTGQITNGQLNVTIGRPDTGYLEEVGDFIRMFNHWGQVTAYPTNARVGALGINLDTESEIGSGSPPNSWTFVEEDVMFVFVDRNVTIIAESAEETGMWWGGTIPGTAYMRAFSITLREGWNAVHWRNATSGTATSATEISTIYHRTPGHLRWTTWEENWDDYSIDFSTDLVPSGSALPGRTNARPSPRARR